MVNKANCAITGLPFYRAEKVVNKYIQNETVLALMGMGNPYFVGGQDGFLRIRSK